MAISKKDFQEREPQKGVNIDKSELEGLGQGWIIENGSENYWAYPMRQLTVALVRTKVVTRMILGCQAILEHA